MLSVLGNNTHQHVYGVNVYNHFKCLHGTVRLRPKVLKSLAQGKEIF